MKYRVFETEQEAIESETQVASQIGCAKAGVNSKTGLPEPQAQLTERWAIHQNAVAPHNAVDAAIKARTDNLPTNTKTELNSIKKNTNLILRAL